MSLLPPQGSGQYGWFGYQGAMCDRALRSDNGPMLQECIDRGFIDADCEVLGFGNVLKFCEARGYTACAEVLRKSLPNKA